jgi:hypothetical protein
MSSPQQSCCYCYKEINEPKKCSKCHKRIFCSQDCQKKDWKLHKNFCGKIGEKNFDWEIKMTKDRGYGVFALRDFKKYEIIMAERVLFKRQHLMNLLSPGLKEEDFPFDENERKAFFELVSDDFDDSFDSKTMMQTLSIFARNAIGDGRFISSEFEDFETQNSVICVEICRINHNCNANVFFWCHSSENSETILVSSSREIKKGSEILTSYCDFNEPTAERQEELDDKYKFICECERCQDVDSDKETIKIKDSFTEMEELLEESEQEDKSIAGINHVKSLLELFSKSKYSADPSIISRALDLGIKFGSKHKSLHEQAKEFIKLAFDHNLSAFGPDFQDTIKNKEYLKNPEIYPTWIQ